MKKNIFLIPAAIILTSLISCKKILDVNPKQFTSDAVTITDENSAKTAVRGIYNQLASNGYYGYTFQTLGFFSGDNIDYVGSQSVNRQLINHDVKADLAALATAWTAIYNTINRANNVLEKVESLPLTATFSDSAKKQLLGEAYFLRALSYFDLARTWGGVQIITKPTASAADQPTVGRSSLAETYAQVSRDLDAAEPLLPNTVNRIRATRKTVWALKARLYLYQQQWSEAESYATKVISDNASYELLKPYGSFFTNNARATREAVLELFYSTSQTNNQASQWQPATKGGVGWIKPTSQIVTLLNDPQVGGNRASLIQKTVTGNVINWFGDLYYRTNGTDPAYLIRIAELYLIRAEAYAHQGKFDEAVADLNAVRSRAEVPPFVSSAKSEILLAIENEKRVEFAFENHRWYDLVRTNRAGEVLGISDPTKFLLPIPFREVLLDKVNLPQNPGYGG